MHLQLELGWDVGCSLDAPLGPEDGVLLGGLVGADDGADDGSEDETIAAASRRRIELC